MLRLSSLPTYKSVSSSRLKHLYSDFLQQKHSNPESFSSNVEWWRRTFEAVLLQGWQAHPDDSASRARDIDKLVLHASGPSFVEEFRYEGIGKPLCLAGVIAELTEAQAYFSLDHFLASSKSIYDPGWLPYRVASYLIVKPLWWALQQLTVVHSDEDRPAHIGDDERWRKFRGDYVILTLLERAAEGVLRQQEKAGPSLADHLFDFDTFKTRFSQDAIPGTTLSDLDVRIVLKYLERDKKAVVVEGKVIKFLDPSAGGSFGITALETGVLELKVGVDNLQLQIDEIQRQLEQRSVKILEALRSKQRDIAMNHLRMQKQIEGLLRKRLASLETLQLTLIRVEAAAGDVEIMKSFQSSTATLRVVLSHPLLQRDKIEETMEAMASAQADAQDIDDIVRSEVEASLDTQGIDDADLDSELQHLVADIEAERAEEEHRKIVQLRVPQHVPQSSEEAWTDTEMDEEFRHARGVPLVT